MPRIAVVAATRWECKAVASTLSEGRARLIGGVPCLDGRRGAHQVFVVRAGVGPVQAAGAAASFLDACAVDVVLSGGYACLLADGAVGDVVVATEVTPLTGDQTENPCPVSTGAGLPCETALGALAVQVAGQRKHHVHAGRVVSGPRVAVTAEEKRRIATKTGAVGLDMESAAIAGAAAQRRIPMGVVRVASDVLDEDLPLDFNRCLGPYGWMTGVALCVRRPSRLVGLMKFRRDVSAATTVLTDVYGGVLDRYE